MIRLSALLIILIATIAPSHVGAQARKPAASPAGQGQALELGTFGEWTAYASPAGRSKVCYILTKPKDRLPKTLTRDPGFLFITSRPAEQVRNEVSFVLGFAAKETTPGEAMIGTTAFALAPKGKNAWLANAAEENSFIEAARRGQSMNVKVTSGRGNASTDRYSLAGLTQALERMRRECP
ncbi:MAG: invasion associated locus B family protein [Bosea sp. (in: a-proteobacteria)]